MISLKILVMIVRQSSKQTIQANVILTFFKKNLGRYNLSAAVIFINFIRFTSNSIKHVINFYADFKKQQFLNNYCFMEY